MKQHARGRALTLSSASSGRCSRISIGSVSAAMTTNSDIPRFSVFVAAPQEPHFSVLLQHEHLAAQQCLHKLTLVSALAQLLVVCSLLHNVQDGVCELTAPGKPMSASTGQHNFCTGVLTAQLRQCALRTCASASG